MLHLSWLWLERPTILSFRTSTLQDWLLSIRTALDYFHLLSSWSQLLAVSPFFILPAIYRLLHNFYDLILVDIDFHDLSPMTYNETPFPLVCQSSRLRLGYAGSVWRHLANFSARGSVARTPLAPSATSLTICKLFLLQLTFVTSIALAFAHRAESFISILRSTRQVTHLRTRYFLSQIYIKSAGQTIFLLLLIVIQTYTSTAHPAILVPLP